jgi:hypothetical protein
VFDCLLYRPQNIDDIPEYTDVQRVLRDEIVNPLRKHLFVRADRVMKLRQFLDNLTSVKGLMSEEKGEGGLEKIAQGPLLVFHNFLSHPLLRTMAGK